MIDKHLMNKREFIKSCCLLGGGLAFGLSNVETLADQLGSYTITDELWKWSKETYHYSKTSNSVICGTCPNTCKLSEGEYGKCRSRINYKGKLYSIAYGNPCAVHVDPIEKKPLLHFLPGTKAYSIAESGCGLRCLNCQNWSISQYGPKETQNYDLMPGKVAAQALAYKCESVAYTYSEPLTWFEYTYDTAKLMHDAGIKNVLKSSGYGNKTPVKKLAKYLDAANIDLKSFSDDIYKELNGGKLQPILTTLQTLKDEGVWLEITNLVIPTWTDDLDMIKRMSEWLVNNKMDDCPLHFSRFHPMYKLTQLPLTPVDTLEKAHDIARDAGIKYVYIGNVPGHKANNTFCHNCGKMIVQRRGYSILRNDIVEGKCGHCGTVIPGVWK